MIKLFQSHKAEASGGIQWVIAGLGNPGAKYDGTRHNVGFLALDLLAQELGITVNRSRFKALCGEGTIDGQRVVLMKPQTFMNLSGEATREALSWYKVPIGASHCSCTMISASRPDAFVYGPRAAMGGHNGLKSIIYQHGSDAFPRVKIGVGMPPRADYDMPAWVLGTFDQADGVP